MGQAKARKLCGSLLRHAKGRSDEAVSKAVATLFQDNTGAVLWNVLDARGKDPQYDGNDLELVAILRCIIGNPLRPVTFLPSWRTETAVALAAGIYSDRAFDRLPILADALEEAGCDHADVLAHCRGPGPHARGCWVVDGVLGKS